MLAQGFALQPDPREVAEVFEVPLAFLLDPANRRRESREIGGRQRRFYAFTMAGHEIWGATAAIIVGSGAAFGWYKPESCGLIRSQHEPWTATTRPSRQRDQR